MHTIQSLPGRTARINDEEWLYFSGTAYLGVVQEPRFRELVKEGIDRYGIHYGGSRLAAIRLPLFGEAEQLLCCLTGAPAALTVSSGSLAGQLVVRHLAPGRTCFFAPGVHPALWPENYTPSHLPYDTWARQLLNAIPQAPTPPLILTNSLDSLYAQPFDFSWLDRLSGSLPITVIVDDSHGFGVCGKKGEGIYPKLKAPDNVTLIAISSLGKAFGMPGGVILGPFSFIEELEQSPFFGGASPISPAFLHAFTRGQDLYRQCLNRLRKNIFRFHQAVASPGQNPPLNPAWPPFHTFDDYPVFFTPDNGLADFLARHRVLLSSFPYPTPNDKLLTRVVINSLHTNEDIDRLVELSRQYWGER